MNGSLDDIAIYNRALTEQEIQNLYAGTTPAACPTLSANLQTGLVGYWPFCGNANDESGNGNDGVVNGATLTEDRFGNVGSAYSFDGVDDFIDCGSMESLNGLSQMSISAWINYSSITNSSRIFGKEESDNSINGIALALDNFNGNENGIKAVLRNGSNSLGYANEVFQPNLLSHVVMVYNGLAPSNDQRMQIYINGVLNNLFFTEEIPNTTPINNFNAWIGGGYPNANDAPFNGVIDDVGVWNRALTPEEVQELYTLDACTFTVYDTLTVENVINVYDTLTIENIVDIYDTTYINVEVYDTLTVENIINVYDTLTIENVIDVFDTTTVVETVVVLDTLTVENVIDVFDTTTVVETVVVFDTLTVENVIDVFDTTTVVETVVVFDTLTVENVIDVYDTTYVTVTDTLIIDIPSGVGGNILNTLLLYPNPTSDQLTISYGNFAAMAGYSLSIFDNGGSTVHENESISQAQETLDITQWSAGVYQVVVYNAGGVPVETRQIVIQ
jgi:hypothetical protein